MEPTVGMRCLWSKNAARSSVGSPAGGCSQLLPTAGAAAALPLPTAPCRASLGPALPQGDAARFLLKLQLYPKPLTTSETLCAHLICVISLSGEIRSSFFHWFFFFSSSEEAVLKQCLKMCCSRFCIFMQDELNAGFFFATLLFIYIYIKCIMKLNHTAQRLQFNGTHSPPVRGTTPLYTLWKIWIIILIIIKIQRKYSIFNKIVNIKQWILYLIRTSPFSSRRQSTKIYFLIWWTYNT